MRKIEEVVKEISDNAQYRNGDPTYLFEGYDVERALHEILEIHKEERPTGEWIRYRDNPHQPEHIKCSNCGQYWSIADHDKIFDICFSCGADMRKGGE